MIINKDSMINIEIDGITFKVKSGSKIIEIADDAGIYIPRFCYHKRLSISANCRMCLVEVEKSPKLVPACATPVSNGMKVFTNTSRVIEAQKSVMEFLLINHPLDCPICDQGGECELQDLTVGYGCSSSRFEYDKRVVDDYDIGPLVSTDLTRCILCSRCVRFCSEIAGKDELGIINRGSVSRIFTFLKSNLTPGISGNVIDLCPVGALTSKPSKFKARSWELIQHHSISHHDCVGSNLYVHVCRNKVIRVVPKKSDFINEVWISDRDRFSYEGLYSLERLNNPIIKVNGNWIDISWDEALLYVCEKIYNIKKEYGSSEIGGLISPNSTVEELYLFQKLLRSIGSNNIDHRLRQIDFSSQEEFPLYPGIDLEINKIDDQDFIFLIGSNIVSEQPIIGVKLRKVAKSGSVFVLNHVDFDFSMDIKKKYIINSNDFINVISSVIKLFLLESKKSLSDYNIENNFFDKINISDSYMDLVNLFLSSKNKLILLGSLSLSFPNYGNLLSLCVLLSKITNSNFGTMTDGSNSSGAWISGCLPHREPAGKKINNIGLNAKEILSNKLKGYILFGVEPDLDSFYGHNVIDSLNSSDFVCTLSSFKSKFLLDVSNIIMPLCSSYENTGTYINVSGIWQSFLSTVKCEKNVKQGWNIICSIANALKISGFSYRDTASIINELKFSTNNVDLNMVWNFLKINEFKNINNNGLVNAYLISQFGCDSLVRRANSLQKTNEAINDRTFLKINNNTYNKMNIKSNNIYISRKNFELKCNIEIDNSISDDYLVINNNFENSNSVFGYPYEPVIVK